MSKLLPPKTIGHTKVNLKYKSPTTEQRKFEGFIMKFLKISLYFALSFSLSGCLTTGLLGPDPDRDTPEFRRVYELTKNQTDAQAKTGQISWVQASTKVRDVDKYLANNQKGYFTSWKFDSDDEEYHSYVIAISERLDQKLITFAAFDAARTAKLNQINTRRQTIDLQRQNIESQAEALRKQNRGTKCVIDRKIGTTVDMRCSPQ